MFSRNKLAREIVEYGKLCGVKNFTPGYSGNISARYKKGLLITTSGSSNAYLKPSEIVHTDFEGNSLEKGKKPSSEKFLHIEIYKQRSDINYIIHVHAPYLSSFASSGKDLILITENSLLINDSTRTLSFGKYSATLNPIKSTTSEYISSLL